jgi:alpha-L-rhamnosidase
MVDVSKLAKTKWHGNWIWQNRVKSRSNKFAEKHAEPRGLLREDVNTFSLLRKKIIVKPDLTKATINITADSRYKLFINGKYIGRGINRCESNFWYYNSYDISNLLKAGENVIAISARFYGWDFAFYNTPEYPGSGDKNGALGGVIFDVELKYGDKIEWEGSGLETKIIKNPGQKSDVPLKGGCLGFIEEYDSTKVPKEWNEVDFDDSEWKSPTILDYPIKSTLIDENSPLDEKFYYASEILDLGECDDITDEYDEEDLEEMDFNIIHMLEDRPSEIKSFKVTNSDCFTGKEGIIEIEALEGTSNKILSVFLKFEKEMVGYPQILVEGPAGTIIDVIPGEKNRDNYCPELAYMDSKRGFRLTMREGKQFFEQWTWEGYLYMLVKVRNLKGTLKIHKIGTNLTHMRITKKGKFNSSNPKLDELWEACAHTVLCCGVDAYLDCPSREQRAYMGDAYPEALVANVCFGEPRLTKKLILDCCFGQRSDGLMYSFHPGDYKRENHIIPDYTLYLIQITKDYYLYYKDEDIIKQTFTHFELAIQYFWKFINPETGLLGNIPYWCFIDWSFSHHKPGTWAIINTQFMDVLNFLADCAEKLGRKDLVEQYSNQSKKMRDSIEKTFWNEKEGCYCDYLDEGELHGLSYMTNSYLILNDIAPKEKWDKIVSRIWEYPGVEDSEKKQIDDFYLKNQSHHAFGDSLKNLVVVAQPFFMHHVNKCFAKIGRYDLLMKFLKKWLPMLELGQTKTIWETWSISASECHAWASTPAYDLSTYWMGVKPSEPGFESVEVSPTFFELTKVEGSYPTCKGGISVNWDKCEDTQVKISITLPKEIKSGTFIIPDLDSKQITEVETKNLPKSSDSKIYVLNSGPNEFILKY